MSELRFINKFPREEKFTYDKRIKLLRERKIAQTEEKNAVASGYWHNFRFDPRLAAEGKPAFSLDSKAPNLENYKAFLNGEVRYNALVRSNPAKAEALFAKSEQLAKEKYAHLQKLVKLYGGEE